jgi:hypothetical protein
MHLIAMKIFETKLQRNEGLTFYEMTSQHAEEAAKPFALQMSIKLCMKTLTALRCVKGMARLRYLIHAPGLSTTQENYTVLCLHYVQSFPFAVLV